jgi:hypothetical protein
MIIDTLRKGIHNKRISFSFLLILKINTPKTIINSIIHHI